MSVRKREWVTAKGEPREAWVVAYSDQNGKPHIKHFARKKDADAWQAQVKVDVKAGTHTPDSDSVTIKEAGERWIRAGESEKLERATLAGYRHHVDAHIVPDLGHVKLSKLTVAMVKDFRNKLCEKRSPNLARKVISSLGAILANAQEDSLVAQNVVRSLSRKKKASKAEQRSKLKVGVDIPAPDEIKTLIASLASRWRPLLLTAIFTGLRSSELRGLRWIDVDLKKGEIHVCQRADRYRKIDKPKSEAGERTVPLTPIVLNTLREWKLACPKGPLGLVFPNKAGNIQTHTNIIDRIWIPAQIVAGITKSAERDGEPIVGKEGRPVLTGKYTGLHALRHFYASWCISRKADGGLELSGKAVQERLGHSKIAMTMDVYGHLFPRSDNAAELAAAESVFFG